MRQIEGEGGLLAAQIIGEDDKRARLREWTAYRRGQIVGKVGRMRQIVGDGSSRSGLELGTGADKSRWSHRLELVLFFSFTGTTLMHG
jgi:hypothetical protein